MSKKKSKKNRDDVVPPSAQPRISKRAIGLILIVLLTAVVIVRNIRPEKGESSLNPLSASDLSGAEPQVAEKIRRLIQQAKQNPDSAESLGELAMNLDVHDFRTESIPLYRRAAEIDPEDFRWRYFGAVALAETGSPQSVEWFEESKRIRPDYVPLLVRFGDLLFRFGKLEEAAKQYKEAVGLDPNSTHALFGLAQIELRRNQLQQSKAHLQRALQINASYHEAKHLLHSINRRLSNATAVEMNLENDKTSLRDPVYASLMAEGVSSLWHSYRGKEYLESGQIEQAIEQFERALKIRADAQTHEDLAAALDQAGKLTEAAGHYAVAAKLHPVFNNFEKLGVIYGKLGRYDEAEHYLKKAISLNPDSAETYFNLSVVYGKTNRYREAIMQLQHAVRLKPDYVSAHYHLGLAYVAVGNKEYAQNQLTIMQRLDSNAAARLKERIASM